MPSIATLSAVGALWLIAVAIPGPNFLVITRLAMLRGRRVALLAVAGIAVGTLCWGLAGLFGVQILFAAVPLLYGALQVVGAIWLVVVGLRAILGSLRPAAVTPVTRDGTALRLGLVTSLSNPKSALLVASLFTALLPPDAPLATGLIVVAEMVAISMAWYAAVSLLVSTATVARSFARMGPWIDRLAGVIFIGFGLRILMSRF